MNVQKLGQCHSTRADAERMLNILFAHAVKVADNKWRSGTSQIWIDSNNQIIVNYGK